MSDGQFERIKATQQEPQQELEDVPSADEGLETVYIKPGTPEHEEIQKVARETAPPAEQTPPSQEVPVQEARELDKIVQEMAEAGPSVESAPTPPSVKAEITPQDAGAIVGDVMESGERDKFRQFYDTLPEQVTDSSGVEHPREELKQNIEAIRQSLNKGNLTEAEQFLQTIPRAEGLRGRVRELTGLWERKRDEARKALDEAYGEQAA